MEVVYRKYRPKLFSEVEGQEHIIRTLQGALFSNRVAHAYLFCGPRGTGKTTTARLFAKAINCSTLRQNKSALTSSESVEPCNACDSCLEINQGRSLDVIELDAASNRGIDEMRNLKDSSRTASTSGAYKTFIIDEVHMLTTPAFNALLKVLEEPPSHVVFIMATTEPHKVLETILSRVQRFDLKKIKTENMLAKLKRVALQEHVEMEEGVYSMIMTASGGSLRDAESTLGKLMGYSESTISVDQAQEILGIVSEKIHANFLHAITTSQVPAALEQINALYESGIHLEEFSKQFITYLRTMLINNVTTSAPQTISNAQLIAIIKAFTVAKYELKTTPIPQLPLELAVIELSKSNVFSLPTKA